MIERRHPHISIVQQCKLLKVSRTSVYQPSKKTKQEDLDLMRLIDEQYLKTPNYGNRSMRTFLNFGSSVFEILLGKRISCFP